MHPNSGFQKGMSPWNQGLTKETDKRVKKIGEISKGNQYTLGKHWKVIDTSNMSKAQKKRYENPENRKKTGILTKKAMEKKKTIKAILKARHACPNKAEKYLDKYLQRILSDEYNFVGDGQFVLGGRCPDFLNINGKKKLIELFGDYWHSERTGKIKKEAENERVDYFKKFGYSTLIIWESELQNLSKLKEKVLTFTIYSLKT